MASAEVLRGLLARTSLPAALIEEFLAETNALWTFGVPDEVVASEAILCHPPLAADEVRAIVDPLASLPGWRITVVTADRPGLLAGTAGTLALEGLSVLDAAVTVLPTSRLALQRLTAVPLTAVPLPGGSLPGGSLPGGPQADADWDQLGRRLRASVGRAEPVRVPFEGHGLVTVDVQPQGDGRMVVTVDAPDIPGLLWAAADWFGTHGGNVEACRVGSEGGRASDVFIVSGPVDGEELAARLAGARTRPGRLARVATWPLGVGTSVLRHLNGRLARPGEGSSLSGEASAPPDQRSAPPDQP